LIEEMRDHLYEQSVSFVAAGTDPVEAANLAIASFGSTEIVFDEFRRELARWSTARTALMLLVGTLAFSTLWAGILGTGPAAPWTEQREPLGLVWTDAVGSFAMALTLLTVAAANILYWLPIRTRTDHPTIRRGPSFAVAACKVSIATLSCSLSSIVAYVVIRVSLAPRSLEWLDIGFGIALTVAALAALVPMARSLKAIPLDIRRQPRPGAVDLSY
jgi:hypothetical protein